MSGRIRKVFTKTLTGLGFSQARDLKEILPFFDADFYSGQYANVGSTRTRMARHYLLTGWKLGHDPSPRFSTTSYLSENPDVAKAGVNPLLHYVRYGRDEGRVAVESESKTVSGRKDKAPDDRRHPDAAFIEGNFDVAFYRTGFPAGSVPDDPVSHYLRIGAQEGRDPAPWFSGFHYLAMYPDVAESGMNPFVHYCIAGQAEHRDLVGLGINQADDIYRAQSFATQPGPLFESFDPSIASRHERKVKALAYYLPQFHPIEVNNHTWGEGFTEWRNLPRANPRFAGHIQPKIPRDLGFYSLTGVEALKKQVALAKAAGLYGFCFYHYAFNGERVLDTPVNLLLDTPEINFPFCLIWANENWTKTWDGAESEIILKQGYDPAHDNRMIDDIARHMVDDRYIRIDGRPLFFIYRPGHIPDPAATIVRWREVFRSTHGLEPLIFMAQGFGDLDPREFGLDGAIEFPPHKLAEDLPPINGSLTLFGKGYSGHVFSYEAMVERSLSEVPPAYPLIKTATPNWDNEARRPGRGMVLHGSTPNRFEDWMRDLTRHALENPVYGEPIVCVNAWNEWAEGAVLEPDVHFGAAYLNALSRAVHDVPQVREGFQRKVLIVGHDANANGAQVLALNIGRTLSAEFGLTVAFLLGGGGPLLAQYREVGEVRIASRDARDRAEAIGDFARTGFRLALVNTTASGAFVAPLKAAGFRVVALVHELPRLITTYGLEIEAQSIAAHSDHVVFPAVAVANGFAAIAGPVAHESSISPQGLFTKETLAADWDVESVRAEFDLPATAKLVLGMGYGDLRKGVDRFVATAISVCADHPDIAFLWVGQLDTETSAWIQPEVDASAFRDRIRIVGYQTEIARLYAAADVFYLSSREDPFPSVVIEALASGLPVVGHEGCGGCDDLIRRHGTLLPHDRPYGAGAALVHEIEHSTAEAAAARSAEIVEGFDFGDYVFGLLHRLVPDLPTVSVIVPNYNHARFVGDRLATIFAQRHPLREIIVLDDASTDNSLAEIEAVTKAAGRRIDLHINAANSGGPFPQWRRGTRMAKADYVWIAESDDFAMPELVDVLVRRMEHTGSDIGFCDMGQIDEAGNSIGQSYRPYLNEIEPGAFDTAFDMEGELFLARFLSVKNVILNVSGTLFRRQALLEALEKVGNELDDYHVAGDWRLYAEICAAGGRVCYVPQVLNNHRLHGSNITHFGNAELHLAEIREMHTRIRKVVALRKDVESLQQRVYAEATAFLGMSDKKNDQGTLAYWAAQDRLKRSSGIFLP